MIQDSRAGSSAARQDQAKADHAVMVQRIEDRAKEMGIPHILAGLKSPDYLSSLELVEIAEVLNTSAYWIITGERDPYEIRLVHCTGTYPYDE